MHSIWEIFIHHTYTSTKAYHKSKSDEILSKNINIYYLERSQAILCKTQCCSDYLRVK